MGKVIIRKWTTKEPLTMIGESAGICWESDIEDEGKNIKRAVDCYLNGHGRPLEFPDVYAIIEGYSARVIREWYTSIGGAPTRLQSSTRYVEWDKDNDNFVIPESVKKFINSNKDNKSSWINLISDFENIIEKMKSYGVPKEDIAMIYPLGMKTKIVDKRNVRNLIDMSRVRMCTRAYWEYRELFYDYRKALSEYSDQWDWIVDNLLHSKCEETKTCNEKNGCGKYPYKGQIVDKIW